MLLLRMVCLLACGALGACAGMLPRGTSDLASRFETFEAARDAIERLVPYQSTVTELQSLGYSVEESSNVTLIPYPQLIGLLSPNPSVPFESLDQGLRDCILSRHTCRVYQYHFGRESRARTGKFLLDFFGFDRTTEVKGWRFEGLVVVRDDLVLFRNFGGEPRIDRVDRNVNPLGPLQEAGDAASRIIRR